MREKIFAKNLKPKPLTKEEKRLRSLRRKRELKQKKLDFQKLAEPIYLMRYE